VEKPLARRLARNNRADATLRRFGIVHLIIASIMFMHGAAALALELSFLEISTGDDEMTVSIAISDSLPSDLKGYIKKGVPVQFDYSIELWKVMPGWFDEMLEKDDVKFKIRYDPWEKEFSILQSTRNLALENILDDEHDALELLRKPEQSSFVVEDTTGLYYLIGSLVIKSMTFSNYREVESWLKGEISGARKPELEEAPNRLGEFVFDMAMKISGLKNISAKSKTDKFRFGDPPDAATPDR